MNVKRVVNLVLLIFVAITIFTLVYKELKTEKKVATPQTTAKVSSAITPSEAELKDVKESKKDTARTEEAKVKKENPQKEKASKADETAGEKKIEPVKSEPTKSEPTKSEETPKEEKSNEKIIVYYFMTTTRCPSCYKIENYTHSCILDKFPNELNSGKMEWKIVNVDEKENAHFIKDYQLFTKSVILSRVIDGKEVEWKNLDKVWDLLYDQNEFYKYIEQETRKFLQGEK